MTPSKRKGVRVENSDEPTELAAPRAPWDNASLSEEHDEVYVDESPSVNPTNQHPIQLPPPIRGGQTSDPPSHLPPDDDAYLEPGTKLGEYVVEAKIGEGGMGVVYSAAHPLIGKRAAIKVLKAELCRSRFNVERFIDEARIVNTIHHPNIVDVFAFGQTTDNRSYFVMEWLKGESLRARVARARLDLDEICDVIRPLARALEAAHEAGVIHRDLKPDNIFLVDVRGDVPTVKLLDFGIAKLSREEHRMERTATGAMVGTPQYIAPEQAKGYSIDARVDIYALGGILFELLTGRPPYVADNAMEMVAKHLMEPVPRPSHFVDTPPELDDLVVRMLSKAPEGRPTLAEVATVIERTSALDRTNVKTPLPAGVLRGAPPESQAINIPTPTPGSMPNLKRLASSPIAASANPGLSAALAKAMAVTPNTTSQTVNATEMTETIRTPDQRRGLGTTAKAAIAIAGFMIALGVGFMVVRSLKKDSAAPEQAKVVEPEPQPEPPPQPSVSPIEEPKPEPPKPEPTLKEDAPKPEPIAPVEPKKPDPPKKAETTKKNPPKPPPKPVAKKGRLELTIVGGGGTPTVLVEGKKGSPAMSLPPGRYNIAVSDKGHKTETFTVVIREDGGTTYKRVELEALPTIKKDPKKDPKLDDLMQPGTLEQKKATDK